MADPLGRAVPLTPVRLSASAWNRMLDAARASRFGSGVPGLGGVPHLLVSVQNDTGAALPAMAVVRLGASVFTDWDRRLANLPAPAFAGETPADGSDPFAVLVEPAAVGKFALAAVAGVVPCEVNVTDAGHGFAEPGATTARLSSASTGPAVILDRESGTGNKKAWVLIGSGVGGGGFVKGKLDGTLSYQGSATLSVWAWNGAAEADTGDNVTVYDWYLSSGQSVAAGTQGGANWDERSGRYIFTGAQCP